MADFCRISRLGLGAALAVVAGLSAASAQDQRAMQQQACSRDVSRYCRKLMNEGDMAIHQCLQQHREKLSPACRRLVEGQ
jgi:ribosomal 50S subunit-associated protein YjgA (DUF615 family)